MQELYMHVKMNSSIASFPKSSTTQESWFTIILLSLAINLISFTSYLQFSFCTVQVLLDLEWCLLDLHWSQNPDSTCSKFSMIIPSRWVYSSSLSFKLSPSHGCTVQTSKYTNWFYLWPWVVFCSFDGIEIYWSV